MTAHRRRRTRLAAATVLVVAVVGAAVGVGAVATDTLGAGHLYQRALAKVDRFLAGPVPDRSAPVTVLVTDPPLVEDTAAPSPTAGADGSVPPPTVEPDSSATPVETATPAPTPARVAVDVNIVAKPKAVFAHEIEVTWCAAAGVQMTLAILGLVDNSSVQQREIQGRVRRWESYRDSHNGDWGPSAMALALDAYGASGYEVRAYQSRQSALRGAARAIQKTDSPVLLLAWRGAHTWVMTGFRADADPSVFADSKIEGAYILDPWYPDVSSIWGPSDPPGTFQDAAEMVRNYLPWKRPEGAYPDRDGLFIAVVPTVRAASAR